MRRKINAAYTVEAAGVMAAVLLTVLILISGAFHIHEKTVGAMRLHTEVEKERHGVAAIDETNISRTVEGKGWELSITAPVFRPEESLRMWSLMEEGA